MRGVEVLIGALRTTLEKPLKVDLHPHQRVAPLVEYRAEDYDVGVGVAGQLRPHELKHLCEQASDRLGILIAGNVLSTLSIGRIGQKQPDHPVRELPDAILKEAVIRT